MNPKDSTHTQLVLDTLRLVLDSYSKNLDSIQHSTNDHTESIPFSRPLSLEEVWRTSWRRSSSSVLVEREGDEPPGVYLGWVPPSGDKYSLGSCSRFFFGRWIDSKMGRFEHFLSCSSLRIALRARTGRGLGPARKARGPARYPKSPGRPGLSFQPASKKNH